MVRRYGTAASSQRTHDGGQTTEDNRKVSPWPGRNAAESRPYLEESTGLLESPRNEYAVPRFPLLAVNMLEVS